MPGVAIRSGSRESEEFFAGTEFSGNFKRETGSSALEARHSFMSSRIKAPMCRRCLLLSLLPPHPENTLSSATIVATTSPTAALTRIPGLTELTSTLFSVPLIDIALGHMDRGSQGTMPPPNFDTEPLTGFFRWRNILNKIFAASRSVHRSRGPCVSLDSTERCLYIKHELRS